MTKDKSKQKSANKKKNKLPAPQSEEELLNKIYTSQAYLNLSPANKAVVKAAVDLYTPEQLKSFKLSKEEINLIHQEAQQRAMEEFNYSKSQFDLDAEQALRQDTAAIKRALDLAKSNPIQDDNTKIAIRNLQDALAESTKQYNVAAERKNTYLQNILEDTKVQLDKSVGRADEDKVIQLRQLERKYNTQLRDVQDNMSQRGLAFSGIRARAEQDLQDEYEDYMTTAEMEAERKKSDAERKAYETERDSRLYTQQELDDLVTQYTGIQKNAIQSAESQLGTGTVQGQLGAYTGVAGTDLNKALYGGLTGTIPAEEQQRKQAEFAAYESKYGTQKLQETFGDQLGNYTPTGGMIGSVNTDLARATKTAEEQKNVNQEALKQQGEDIYLASKGLPTI